MKTTLRFPDNLNPQFTIEIDEHTVVVKTIEICYSQYQLSIRCEDTGQVSFTFMSERDYLKNEQLKSIVYEINDPKCRIFESYIFDISAYRWNEKDKEIRLIFYFSAFSELLHLVFRGYYPVKIQSAFLITV
ncbi:MAG: hypothetical protein ACFFCZ_19405 [Promethearchaeota archaeon]